MSSYHALKCKFGLALFGVLQAVFVLQAMLLWCENDDLNFSSIDSEV